MKTIKRWIENIKWVFNHPPTSITSANDEYDKCEFCGSDCNGWVRYTGVTQKLCICHDCIITAFRNSLTKKDA